MGSEPQLTEWLLYDSNASYHNFCFSFKIYNNAMVYINLALIILGVPGLRHFLRNGGEEGRL